jgi:hypothetical protein
MENINSLTETKWLISPLFMSKLMHRVAVEMAILSVANTIDKKLINVLISYKYKEIENIVQKVANDFVLEKLPIEYLGDIHSTFLDKLIEELKNSQK